MYLPQPEVNLLQEIISSVPEIKLAYLFGSFAQGTATTNSDIDIAVLYNENKLPSRLTPLETSMALEIETHMRREIDLRIINHAPLFFLFQVVSTGQPLFAVSEDLRITFENYVTGRFFDFRPFMDVYEQYQEERIKRGEFGVKPGKHKITAG